MSQRYVLRDYHTEQQHFYQFLNKILGLVLLPFGNIMHSNHVFDFFFRFVLFQYGHEKIPERERSH